MAGHGEPQRPFAAVGVVALEIEGAAAGEQFRGRLAQEQVRRIRVGRPGVDDDAIAGQALISLSGILIGIYLIGLWGLTGTVIATVIICLMRLWIFLTRLEIQKCRTLRKVTSVKIEY